MAKCFEKHKDLGEAELCASNMTYPSTLLRKTLKSKVDPCMVHSPSLKLKKEHSFCYFACEDKSGDKDCFDKCTSQIDQCLDAAKQEITEVYKDTNYNFLKIANSAPPDYLKHA